MGGSLCQIEPQACQKFRLKDLTLGLDQKLSWYHSSLIVYPTQPQLSFQEPSSLWPLAATPSHYQGSGKALGCIQQLPLNYWGKILEVVDT